MVDLTFGEQVKLILGRKGMTIKQLAELFEERTGKPMSRQNMTQRLGRDNFQEQDMRLIAEILGCKFVLSIMEAEPSVEAEGEREWAAVEPTVESIAEMVEEQITAQAKTEELHPLEREITVGELADMGAEVQEAEMTMQAEEEQPKEAAGSEDSEEKNLLRKGIKGYFRKNTPVGGEAARTETVPPEWTKPKEKSAESEKVVGDINPYTGKEYKTNSVRIHPKRIGYVQVYDQEQHKWTDMTEWAFLGYQERKKVLLGKNYEPPIYLD